MAADPLRIARTESLFRDVNERIAETAERFGASNAEFVCECADTDCDERFEADLAQYEQVRADGVRFFVAPGHEEPRYETVVHSRSRYRVVAKNKDRRIAKAVRRLDPRADDEPASGDSDQALSE
jgi:hypothetical protein